MTARQKNAAADMVRVLASLPVEERVEVVATVVQVFARCKGLVREGEQRLDGVAVSDEPPR